MLVVERVPLELLEQVAGVHHLEAQHAVGREHLGGRLEDRVRGPSLWAKTLEPVTRSAARRRARAARGTISRRERARDHVAALRRAPSR